MKGNQSRQSAEPSHRVNERIRISPVMLIASDGSKLGVTPTAQAMEMAREEGLDLVEIVPTDRPPVCRILDYGKFRYDKGKSKKSQKKQAQLKEVRLRPKTDVADKARAVDKARKFLLAGHPVQFTMLFRGRENAFKSDSIRAMSDIAAILDDVGQLDRPPTPAGRRATMVITPRKQERPKKPRPPKDEPQSPPHTPDSVGGSSDGPTPV